MSRSELRNLCCTALGQASAFNLVSDNPYEMTEEEIKAIKETGKLLVESIKNMLKIISNDELKITPAQIEFIEKAVTLGYRSQDSSNAWEHVKNSLS